MKPHKFFNQPADALISLWGELVEPLLLNFEISKNDIAKIKVSYFYFINNASDFDGATVVADRYFIKNLDITAMEHDYDYIKSKNIWQRIRADIVYAKRMRELKFEWYVAWGRCALLIFFNITGIYWLYKKLKK